MISLELLTVLVVGPLACLVCYDIAKKNPRANILMTVIATAELYGGASRPRHLPKSPLPFSPVFCCSCSCFPLPRNNDANDPSQAS